MDGREAKDLADVAAGTGAIQGTAALVGKIGAATLGTGALATGTTAVGSGIATASGVIAAHTSATFAPLFIAIASANPLGLGIIAVGAVAVGLGCAYRKETHKPVNSGPKEFLSISKNRVQKPAANKPWDTIEWE